MRDPGRRRIYGHLGLWTLVTVWTAIGTTSCESRYRELPLQMRTIEDQRRGIRFVIAQGWQGYDRGMRANDGSFISYDVWDLREAKRSWVDALPESLYPQLDEWAFHDFLVEGERRLSRGKIGPEEAAVVAYTIRTKPDDKPGFLRFYIVKKEERLWVIRAVLPPWAWEHSRKAIEEILASIEFLDPPPAVYPE
jgi:hypothetical protein